MNIEQRMSLWQKLLPVLAPSDPPAGDPPAGDPSADPPAGDPPASDPPAGDPPAMPPAGDPPAGDPPATTPFAELDSDSQEWLAENGVTTVAEAAKFARDQASLLGNAIRVPGKDASDEERNTFLDKLGRPEDKSGYEFEVPPDLPEQLPYDAERAERFKEVAHSLGLTPTQANGLHDWSAKESVSDFETTKGRAEEQQQEIASQETDKLVKRWGPMDGDTAKANLAYADAAIRDLGGAEAVESLKKWGILTENNLLQDETLAVMFSNIGMSLFKEDDIVRGKIDFVGNPFAEGEHLNITKQHQIAKADPERARNLARAAGKDPAEVGL